MGNSSRRSGITEMGHSPGMVRMTAMCFPRTDATPGERCAIDLDMRLATDFPQTDATPGERYVIGLDITTVPNLPRMDATPGDRCAIDLDMTLATEFPRTSATPGEMCTMDVGFRPDVIVPRTSSNPGEISAVELRCSTDIDITTVQIVPRTSSNPGAIGVVELGCRSVLGFSQVDSAQSKCGAVELDFRRANFPPGEIGAEECDYIRPAPLAGLSDMECLPYQGRDCIRDFSASRTLSPSLSDLTCLARGARMLLMAPLAILGRCPRQPSCRRYWWTLERRCRHPTSPGCCPGYACWPCWPVGDVAPVRL